MTQKTDITNRDDVAKLVNAFYNKVRIHESLGPIFNQIITDWNSHLTLLIDFWETQLFLTKSYLGNPISVHQQVDDKVNNTVTSEHFGLWLNLWYETIDELFEGETAWLAKNRAQKMSTMLFLKIFEHRKN